MACFTFKEKGVVKSYFHNPLIIKAVWTGLGMRLTHRSGLSGGLLVDVGGGCTALRRWQPAMPVFPAWLSILSIKEPVISLCFISHGLLYLGVTIYY
jgi:hypothetical protein